MWFLAPAQGMRPVLRRADEGVTFALVTGFMGAAVFSALMAWSQVQFQNRYLHRYGSALLQLAKAPDGDCPKLYVICGKWKPEARKEMIAFLAANDLNVFARGHESASRPGLNK